MLGHNEAKRIVLPLWAKKFKGNTCLSLSTEQYYSKQNWVLRFSGLSWQSFSPQNTWNRGPKKMENSWNFRKNSWVTNSTVSWIKQKVRNFRKTSTSASLIIPKPLTVWITTNWKMVKEMGNTQPPYLSPNKPVCRSRSNRTKQETIDWFTIGKAVHQGCILLPCLFNLYAEYVMLNARVNKAQAIIKIARWNINNLRYANDTILMAEREEVLKSQKVFFFFFFSEVGIAFIEASLAGLLGIRSFLMKVE